MKLIGSLTSPYVRKARIVLAEKKIEYEFAIDSPWNADSNVPNVNPLGKIPVLTLDDSTVLFDSRVIVEYIDSVAPNNKLMPESNRERAEVKTWEALADGLLDAAALARLEATWPGRSDEQRSQAWMDRQMGKVKAALQVMSQGLGEKPFCCGGIHLTLADISVCCALAWLDFRFPELDWRADHANLDALLKKLSQRPSFVNTVPH